MGSRIQLEIDGKSNFFVQGVSYFLRVILENVLFFLFDISVLFCLFLTLPVTVNEPFFFFFFLTGVLYFLIFLKMYFVFFCAVMTDLVLLLLLLKYLNNYWMNGHNDLYTYSCLTKILGYVH